MTTDTERVSQELERELEDGIFEENSGKSNIKNKLKKTYSSFIELKDGRIAEEIYSTEGNMKYQFAIYDTRNNSVEYKSYVEKDGIKIFPFDDEIIGKKAILLPSGVEEYGSEQKLIENIIVFIHKYLDVDEFFEKLSAFYILFIFSESLIVCLI